MSKFDQTGYGSDIYALVQEARMSEAERAAALKAMQDAEAIVDAFFWVRGKLAAVSDFFLHPSLKH